MKKITILIYTLLSLFITTLIYASDVYEYVWTDTYVTVQINDDLSKYTSKPQAILKKNNAELKDALISYNINGDWLYYLKDVDTTRIGEYKVWYKASESKYNPGHCKNYKSLVTFKVVDENSKIDLNVLGEYDEKLDAKVFGFSARSGKVDLKDEKILSVESKYDTTTVFDDSNVKYDTPGIYKVIAYVTDTRSYTESIKFYLIVKDTKNPIVNPIKDMITIERNEEIIWKDYFKIEDDIIDTYEYIPIDYNPTLIDTFQIVRVKVIDSSGNYTYGKIKVMIKDTIKPQITLKSLRINLDFGTSYDKNYFYQFIDEATDGDKDITSSVDIDVSALDTRVGEYEVKYFVYDDDNNYTEELLNVNVISKIPPIIEVKNATIKVNEDFDFRNYVTVIDESDPDLINRLYEERLDFDNKVPGTYFIKIFGTNTSQMSTHAIMKVTVIDDKVEIPYVKIIAVIGVIAIVVGYLLYKKKNVDKDDDKLPIDI